MTQTRRLFVTIHRWLGLTVGAYLVIQALTGIVLIYRDNLTALSLSELSAAGNKAVAHRVDAEQAIDLAREHFPGYRISRLDMPTHTIPYYIAHLSGEEGELREVYISAATGTIETPYLASVLAVVFDIHHLLWGGDSGRYAVGMVGAALALMSAIGLYIGWPRVRGARKVLKLMLTSRAARTLFNVHRTGGFLMVMFLLVSSTTGFLLAFGPVLRPLVLDSSAPVPVPAAEPKHAALPVSTLMTIATEQVAAGEVRDMRFGAGQDVPNRFLIRRTDGSRELPPHQVWLDPYTGAVLKVVDSRQLDPAAALFAWLYPIHIEYALGNIGRGLMNVTAIGLIALFLTGGYLWLRKQRKKMSQTTTGKTVQRRKEALS